MKAVIFKILLPRPIKNYDKPLLTFLKHFFSLSYSKQVVVVKILNSPTTFSWLLSSNRRRFIQKEMGAKSC